MRPPLMITAVAVLLLALVACSAPPGTTLEPATDDTNPPVDAASSKPDAAAPPPAGGSGPAGTVYTGNLIDALPRVIGGADVEVHAVSAADLEDIDESTLLLMDELGVERGDAEMAMAISEEAGVMVFALRLPGVDSATIDSTFMGLQEQDTGTHNFRVASLAGRNVHAWDAVHGTTHAWVNGDILFWLYGDDAGAAQAIAAMPMPTVALQPSGDDGDRRARAEVTMTLADGPDAGTHGKAVTEAGGGGCSRNPMDADTYGFVSYPEDAVANLRDVNLFIRDGAGATGGGTDDFVLDVAMVSGSSHSLNPAAGRGSGSVLVQDDGNQASFEISGTTEEGFGIELMVTCDLVLDFGS